jgi:hypothetical protein
MDYNLFSYHIFYFPFKWEKKGFESKKFSTRFDLNNVKPTDDSYWENLPLPHTDEYLAELYNEKNFFYDFVHNVLYDSGEKNNIIRHYERKEAYQTDLFYEIKVIANGKQDLYRLRLKSIVLNLYSTGTGILIFYLENDQYPELNDILRINQYGRRVFPPYLSVHDGVIGTKKAELADYVAITGLNGSPTRYFDDFIQYTPSSRTWRACRFIQSLIEDLSPEIEIEPVIDDRMHVVSWIGNDDYAEKVKKDSTLCDENDDWYRFLFIDGGGCTCQNDKMKKEILEKHTYLRWQKEGSIFGISRYSMVLSSGANDFCREVLLRNFRTMYARMVELSLIQRASILKFADEVTHLSGLKDNKSSQLADKISDFYREYIRFVNQIYFREVTAQEQGIEMYDMIQEKMKISDQVKDLDNEIGELHQYAVLLEDKERNNSLSILSMIGAIFIIPSFIVGFYSMNIIEYDPIRNLWAYPWIAILAGAILSPIMVLFYFRSYGKKKRYWCLIFATLSLLIALLTPFIH